MYVGIDIGGTKTLVAVLDDNAIILEKFKFPTPRDYDEFLVELKAALAGFEHKEFSAGGLGMPATIIDREHGRGVNYGNLPWENVPVQHDVERITRCPMAIENDAKMAALSEAMLLKEFKKVLYITVSTGIGYGLVTNGEIDTNVGDGGGAAIMLEHKDKFVPWESFASGHAIVDRYGKRAEDIHDAATWHKICRDLAQGFVELIAIMQPEVIVIGGSVGTYFDRYGEILVKEIEKFKMPLISIPEFRQAQRPEEAVVYGCFDLALQRFPHAKTDH